MTKDLEKNRQTLALAKFHEGQCIPAIPLCLDADRQFDEKGQRDLVLRYLVAGVGGIAVAVHTTQFAIRDPKINLFEPVLRITSETIDEYAREHEGITLKVAGVCGPTEQAVEEAKIAKHLGYDFVLLSTGGLNDWSEDDLVIRTKAVSEIMPVIGFAMQTAVGGRIFSDKYWEDVCAIDRVIGVKCAPFNRYATIQIARAACFAKRSEPITLYTGNDDNIIVDLLTPFQFKDDEGESHEIWIKGGLLGHWSVWTPAAVSLFNELKALRLSGVKEIPLSWLTKAAQLTEANGAVFDWRNNFSGCIPGVHAGLIDDGWMAHILTLEPDEVLSDGQWDLIRQAKKDYPDLT